IDMLRNRPPVANPDQITAYEDDGGPVVFSTDHLLANDTDPNPWDVLTVTAVGTSGVDAAVSMTDGVVTYDIGSGFQYLSQGEILQDSFTYIVSDIKGATDEGVVNVDIIGVNDIPITEADMAQVTEDLAPVAQGNVLANDYDIDLADVLRVAEPGVYAGTYGSLSLTEDGAYTYTLENESNIVQTLGRHHVVTEHFDYMVSDGIAEVASSLEVTLSGVNDAPIVAMPLEDRHLTFHKPFSWKMPKDSFIDIDQGDVLDYTATLADGSPLPEWLSFDAEKQTFSGWTPKMVDYVDVQVTATDRVAATGSTEGSLSAADVFRVFVNHGNQGVGNGVDATPPGHDRDFNDDPGTAPGNPGAKGGNGNANGWGLDLLVESGLTGNSDKGKDGAPGQIVAEAVSARDKKKPDFYLKAADWDKNSAGGNSVSFGNQAAVFARWLAMDLAVSEALANRQSLSWLDDRFGADASALGRAGDGMLGSTHMFGKDGFSLLAGNGHDLKTFRGLDDGLRKIA
ncbi:MAG: VCBS domain-containing protein, partial [Desulfobacteraceae bacterium]|nr:VCBS domain-containing protein [Desulfobacteraceae bacterium]